MSVPVSDKEQSSFKHFVNFLLFPLSIRDIAVPSTAVSGSWSGGSQDGDAVFGNTGKKLTSSFGGVS